MLNFVRKCQIVLLGGFIVLLLFPSAVFDKWLPAHGIVHFPMPILIGISWCLIVVSVCISLTTNDFVYLFICLFAIHIFSLVSCLTILFFKNVLFLDFGSYFVNKSGYIVDKSLLSDIWLEKKFFPFWFIFLVCYHFTLKNSSFQFWWNLVYHFFLLWIMLLMCYLRTLSNPRSQRFVSYFLK